MTSLSLSAQIFVGSYRVPLQSEVGMSSWGTINYLHSMCRCGMNGAKMHKLAIAMLMFAPLLTSNASSGEFGNIFGAPVEEASRRASARA
jgi:hypothetical protein